MIIIWLALVTNTWPLTQRVLPPLLLTSYRKTSALWDCVHTTPNWSKGLRDSLRWGRLISSQQVTDLPTAYNIIILTQRIKVIGEFPTYRDPLDLYVASSWERLAQVKQVTQNCWTLVGVLYWLMSSLVRLCPVMLSLQVLCGKCSLETLRGIPMWTANQGYGLHLPF